MRLNAYLIFDGDCRQAMEFYHQCLGGELTVMDYSHPDVASHTPAHWREKVMHARLTVGDAVLMASDGRPGETGKKYGFSVSLQVDKAGEADKQFAALQEGGTVTMPIGETFWAERFGMLVDKFGVPWMINSERSTA
ncbi:VOC family protein [Rhizobium jaguaris]|uniref:VOC family protein n=1 Tax=Rhizobium jaguaris TaxID=1312183 RepID=UPI0039BF23A8